MIKTKIIIGSLGTFATAATAAAIAVPIVISNTAKDLLSSFVLVHRYDKADDLSKIQKINYVALGDSITAGDNLATGLTGDYISYADFLAKDLQNHDRLGSYRNFAVSGATISETHQLITGDVSIINAILKDDKDKLDKVRGANLISMSIGSNDLLKAIEIMGIPMKPNVSKLFSSTIDANPYRNSSVSSEKGTESESEWAPNAGTSTAKSNNAYNGILSRAIDMVYKKDFSRVIGLNDSFAKQTFSLMERSLLIMIRDLHLMAPRAKIKFVFPEMPLYGLPKEILDTKIDFNGEKIGIVEFYNKFKDMIKETVKFGFIDFVDFNTVLDSKAKSFMTDATNLKKESDAHIAEIEEIRNDIESKKAAISAQQDTIFPTIANDHPELATHGITNIFQLQTYTADNVEAAKIPPAEQDQDYSTYEYDTNAKVGDVYYEINTVARPTQYDPDNIDKKWITLPAKVKTAYAEFEKLNKDLATQESRKLKEVTPLVNKYQAINDNANLINEYSKWLIASHLDKDPTQILSAIYMSDKADIHPNVLAHYEFGTKLFQDVAREAGIEVDKAKIQYLVEATNNGVIDNWENLDQPDFTKPVTQTEWVHYVVDQTENSTFSKASRLVGKVVTSDKTKDTFKILVDFINELMGTGMQARPNKVTVDTKGIHDVVPASSLDILSVATAVLKENGIQIFNILIKELFWDGNPNKAANRTAIKGLFKNYILNTDDDAKNFRDWRNSDIAEWLLANNASSVVPLSGNERITDINTVTDPLNPGTTYDLFNDEAMSYFAANKMYTLGDVEVFLANREMADTLEGIAILFEPVFNYGQAASFDDASLLKEQDRFVKVAEEMQLDSKYVDYIKAMTSNEFLDNVVFQIIFNFIANANSSDPLLKLTKTS